MNKNGLKNKKKKNKMEESLDNLFNINKSLISKKNELRKKIYETIVNCIFFPVLEIEESTFFKRASRIFNDKEFDELFKKYEKLSYLICSIDEFKKED